MKTYQSGQTAEYGIYVAPKALDFRFVGADGERLEGKGSINYYRLPALLMIALSPVIGGVFVMAFPLIVVGFVIGLTVKVAASKVKAMAHEYAHLSTMRWEPTAAYLNKIEKEKKETKVEEKKDNTDSDKQ